MGNSVSTAQNNDQLVDNLMDLKYIKTKKVEEVLRAVDRGDYAILKENLAYKDIAWKRGNIHLSAPCIYGVVLEALQIEPGMSFLNLGSGTGYLNTVAGLLLKQRGINHGIELYEDCVKYAYKHLEDFKQKSQALDKFDFCEPVFIQGNCLSLAPDRQYDRVYCGAACPKAYIEFIKKFVSPGGILIIPYDDELIQMQRAHDDSRNKGDARWSIEPLLSVTFATLVIPSPEEQTLIHLPDCNPLSLQELCRGRIRNCIRERVWREHADVETKKPIVGQHVTCTPERILDQFICPDEPFRMHHFMEDANSDSMLATTVEILSTILQTPPRDSANGSYDVDDDDDDNNQQASTSPEATDTQNLENSSTSISEESTSQEQSFPSSSSRENNSADSSSDSAYEDHRRQSFRATNKSEIRATTSRKTNSSIIDGNSESDDNDSSKQSTESSAKRGKTDSAAAEDVVVLTYQAGCTRPSMTRRSSKTTNSQDRNESTKVNDSYGCASPNENVLCGHYVDNDAFTTYMKEIICQLPMPFALKSYVNYNRQL